MTNNQQPSVYIVDSLGQRFELVQFFDHDSQQYLFALRFIPKQDPNPNEERR